MTKPTAKRLLSWTNGKTQFTDVVSEAKGVYAVFYDGEPINYHVEHSLISKMPKYKRTVYPSPAHAFNLAEKLNKLFMTDKFEVYKLIGGERITEEKK